MKSWLAGLMVLAAILLAPAAAQAKWLRAESPRFVLYGDVSEAEAKAYILRLETFDSTLRVIHGLPDAAPPTKFNVYLVRNVAGLRRVWPGVSERIAGYYTAGTEDVFAVAIFDSDGQNTLLHEYVHHFMAQNLPGTYSAWVREGYAEYFSTTEMRGQFVEVGVPAQGRANELQYFSWLPLEDVLAKNAFEAGDGPFYAQSWLMTHYFMSDPGRRKQLDAYLRAIGEGTAPVAAMEQSTGLSLAQLEKTLRTYLRGGMKYTQYTRSGYAAPAVAVTAVGPGEAEVLLEAQQTKMGVAKTERQALLEKLRAAVARYPGERYPTLALAHAEISFGDRAAGEGLLRKLIDADPKDAEALETLAESRRYAGDEAEDDNVRIEAYRESGRLLGLAHKANNRRYQTLFAFAESRRYEPGYPNENTLEVLIVAQKLAPQVAEISLETARGLMLRRRYDEAEAMLKPLANNPHGGDAADAAKTLLRQLKTVR